MRYMRALLILMAVWLIKVSGAHAPMVLNEAGLGFLPLNEAKYSFDQRIWADKDATNG